MINTILLGVIAATLLWTFVWPQIAARYGRHRRQRKVSVAQSPRVSTVPSTSMHLRLCNETGLVEHEISFSGRDAPEAYEYGGKVYRQEKRVHTDDPTDYIWEYRR